MKEKPDNSVSREPQMQATIADRLAGKRRNRQMEDV